MRHAAAAALRLLCLGSACQQAGIDPAAATAQAKPDQHTHAAFINPQQAHTCMAWKDEELHGHTSRHVSLCMIHTLTRCMLTGALYRGHAINVCSWPARCA